jgi:hypothetical protein
VSSLVKPTEHDPPKKRTTELYAGFVLTSVKKDCGFIDCLCEIKEPDRAAGAGEKTRINQQLWIVDRQSRIGDFGASAVCRLYHSFFSVSL